MSAHRGGEIWCTTGYIPTVIGIGVRHRQARKGGPIRQHNSQARCVWGTCRVYRQHWKTVVQRGRRRDWMTCRQRNGSGETCTEREEVNGRRGRDE